jgi:hypothetical protein
MINNPSTERERYELKIAAPLNGEVISRIDAICEEHRILVCFLSMSIEGFVIEANENELAAIRSALLAEKLITDEVNHPGRAYRSEDSGSSDN